MSKSKRPGPVETPLSPAKLDRMGETTEVRVHIEDVKIRSGDSGRDIVARKEVAREHKFIGSKLTIAEAKQLKVKTEDWRAIVVKKDKAGKKKPPSQFTCMVDTTHGRRRFIIDAETYEALCPQ